MEDNNITCPNCGNQLSVEKNKRSKEEWKEIFRKTVERTRKLQ